MKCLNKRILNSVSLSTFRLIPVTYLFIKKAIILKSKNIFILDLGSQHVDHFPLSSCPADPTFWLVLSYPRAAPAAVYLRPHSKLLTCFPLVVLSILFLVLCLLSLLLWLNFPKKVNRSDSQ